MLPARQEGLQEERKRVGFFFALQERGAMNTFPGRALQGRASQVWQRELNAVLQETLNWSYIYLEAPSQKRLIRRITKLVEEAAPEHCNAPCCLSLTGAEECRGTLRFRQHCLLFKCCQDDRTLAPAWLPKGK